MNICVRLKTSMFESMQNWLRNKIHSLRQHGRFYVAEGLTFSVSCETASTGSVKGYPKLNLYHVPLLLYFYLAHSYVGPIVILCICSKFVLYSPSFCSLMKDSFVSINIPIYLYTDFLNFPLTKYFLFNICNCVAHHSSGQYLSYEWHKQNIYYYS
jgi:hypothetical protein